MLILYYALGSDVTGYVWSLIPLSIFATAKFIILPLNNVVASISFLSPSNKKYKCGCVINCFFCVNTLSNSFLHMQSVY